MAQRPRPLQGLPPPPSLWSPCRRPAAAPPLLLVRWAPCRPGGALERPGWLAARPPRAAGHVAASAACAPRRHTSAAVPPLPRSRVSVPHQGSNSRGEDPLLLHVAEYLARTRRQQAGQRAPFGPRSSGSGLSGGVRQWECGWEEVAVLQRTPLGRGSFGKVNPRACRQLPGYAAALGSWTCCSRTGHLPA